MAAAPAPLTNEIPTCISTSCAALGANVRYSPWHDVPEHEGAPGTTPSLVNVPACSKGRSKWATKCTVYGVPVPQKPPLVTWPVTSSELTACTATDVSGFALSATLKTSCSGAPEGKVNRPRPVRVVTARDTSMPAGPSRTP